MLSNCDDSPSKDLWLEHGWAEEELDQEELYDLLFDPVEKNNLVTKNKLKPVLQEMRDRLDLWMRETNDPLLKGPVPAPPGSWVNSPDAISPGKIEIDPKERKGKDRQRGKDEG